MLLLLLLLECTFLHPKTMPPKLKAVTRLKLPCKTVSHFEWVVSRVGASVTRFGEICHFGKSLQSFGKFFTVYLLCGKMLTLLWQICDISGLIFNVANGQTLKNYLTIGSYWFAHYQQNKMLQLIFRPATGWVTRQHATQSECYRFKVIRLVIGKVARHSFILLCVAWEQCDQ